MNAFSHRSDSQVPKKKRIIIFELCNLLEGLLFCVPNVAVLNSEEPVGPEISLHTKMRKKADFYNGGELLTVFSFRFPSKHPSLSVAASLA